MNQTATLDLSRLPEPESFTPTDASDFARKVMASNQPFVMRNLCPHWPMVQAARQSTDTFMALLNQHAAGVRSTLVSLPAEYNRRLFYSDDLQGLNHQRQPVSIAEGLATITAANENTGSHCFQSLPLSEGLPGLAGEHTNPLLNPGTRSFIWLGNRIVVAPHFDEADNIAVVVAGRRRFTLFPPNQVENLYIGPLDFTPAGQPISMVDTRAPDLNKHPRYAKAYAHALSVELGPGDAIYIPSPWWHQVESLDEINGLVNFWWSNAFVSTALPMPAMLHAMQALGHMTEDKKRQWQDIFAHYLLQPVEDISQHIPESSRGILGKLTRAQADQLDKWLKQQF